MTHKLTKVERNRPDAPGGNVTYLTHDDGFVIAYGPERDGPRPNLWIASLWKGHPLDDENAEHVEHLAADSTWSELHSNISAWQRGNWP